MAKKEERTRITTKAAVPTEHAAKRTESEGRYREFVEGADDLFTQVDGDGRFIYVNRAAETVLGVKPEACVGLSAFDFIHPDDRTRTQEWFEVCLRDQVSSATIENRQMSRTGEVRQVLWTCNFQYDASGTATGVRSIARDITERKQVEEELAYFQKLADASGQCFGMIDLDGEIIYGNPALLCLCGVENVGELQGESFKSYHPAEDREMLEKEVLPTIMREGQWVGELTLLSRTGKSTSVISNHFLIRDERGEPCRLAAVMTDITERRSAEKRLEAEGRLSKQLLDLQELERKLVAHEIHDGMVQDAVGAKMLLEGIVSDSANESRLRNGGIEKVKKLLVKTIAEGRRLIRELRPMILDEEGIVEAIKHLVVSEYCDPSIQVELLLPERLDRFDPMVEGTVFRIVKEALINVKRHSQSPTVVIKLAQRDQQLLLEIQDHGVGFDPDKVPEARFGLRGIRERARLFGGYATIESAPGHGSCIMVALPVVAKVAAQAEGTEDGGHEDEGRSCC